MAEIEGFILAGGASSRMGEDKALLRLGGEPFVGRAARALGGVAGRVRVVSSRHEAAALGLEVLPDLYGGRGALGGIHAALAACDAPWAAVLSCDLPFVTGELLARLASFRASVTDAVAPTQEDGRPQPLCAFYARDPCLRMTEDLIRTGELRPRALLRQVRTRWVGFEELEDLDGSGLFFRNVNTPEDYRRALDEAKPGEVW
ncbi:MAG TPA: molybdenum cofactor guanylyltransferase [Pyrinomonadaceae bacterium]|nr:molybdenum cofactor guanylyltransferase [Pyrinomonadaceae bacterium]